MRMITVTRTALALSILAFIFFFVGFVMPLWFGRYFSQVTAATDGRLMFGLWYYVACNLVTTGCTSEGEVLRSDSLFFKGATSSTGSIEIEVLVIPILATIALALCCFAIIALFVAHCGPFKKHYDYKMWLVFACGLHMITIFITGILTIMAIVCLVEFFDGMELKSAVEFPWSLLCYIIAALLLLVAAFMYSFIIRHWRRYRNLYGRSIDYWMDQDDHVAIPVDVDYTRNGDTIADGMNAGYGYNKRSFKQEYTTPGYIVRTKQPGQFLDDLLHSKEPRYLSDTNRDGYYDDRRREPYYTTKALPAGEKTAVTRYYGPSEMHEKTRTVWDDQRKSVELYQPPSTKPRRVRDYAYDDMYVDYSPKYEDKRSTYFREDPYLTSRYSRDFGESAYAGSKLTKVVQEGNQRYDDREGNRIMFYRGKVGENYPLRRFPYNEHPYTPYDREINKHDYIWNTRNSGRYDPQDRNVSRTQPKRSRAYDDYDYERIRSNRLSPRTGRRRESVASYSESVHGGGPDYFYMPSYRKLDRPQSRHYY